jgi:hypothetical protein
MDLWFLERIYILEPFCDDDDDDPSWITDHFGYRGRSSAPRSRGRSEAECVHILVAPIRLY